jgi:hypothetical protein
LIESVNLRNLFTFVLKGQGYAQSSAAFTQHNELTEPCQSSVASLRQPSAEATSSWRRNLSCAATLTAALIFVAMIPQAVNAIRQSRLRQVIVGWLRGVDSLEEMGLVRQQSSNDCGVACLQMVFRARGMDVPAARLRAETATTERGTSLLELKRVAEAHGLATSSWRLKSESLKKIPLPAIAFVDGDHYVVIERIENDHQVIVLDPAGGRLRYELSAFAQRWRGEILILGDFAPAEQVSDS